MDLALTFWGFLFVYGGVMYALSPRAVTVRAFYQGTDTRGAARERLVAGLQRFHQLDLRQVGDQRRPTSAPTTG